MKRVNEFIYVFKHKVAIFQLWKKYNTKVSLYRVLMHDFIKMFNILLFGDEIATKIHRKCARHHIRKTEKDFYESYLDWASARITKPDKPLDAIQTAQKWYPEYYDKSIEHYKNVKYK